MKTITAANLKKIVKDAVTTTDPTAARGRTVGQNVQSSIGKIKNVPDAGGTGAVTNR